MPDSVREERLDLLSPKERDCLRLVLENHSSKQIARQLGISQTSVDTHISRARAKLGVRDRYEAARLLAAWEGGQQTAVPEPEPSPAPQAPPRGRPPGQLLPPLASLNFGQRLLMMALGALVIASVCGLILSAMAVL
jgi:DNA-binding CsgD family transcriptional regulator